MPSSIHSHRSGSSGKLRPIASRNSHVDESLFGRRKSQPILDARKKEEIARISQEIRSGDLKNPNAILIPQTEILRMKQSAVILSKEDIIQQKKIADEQAEKMMAAAKAKKQKMMEIEAERKKHVPLTEDDIEEKMRNNSLLNRAQEILDEQRDDVKQMNQLILHAKVVTVRDKQLQEKKDIQEQRKLEEKRRDLMMEVERLKKVKQYDEEEKARKIEQKRGHLLIVDQIREREIERLKLQEEKEKEAQEMIRLDKQKKIDESNAGLQRKHQQKVLLDQIYEANQQAIVSKSDKINREKLEDEKIYRYNLEKAQKENELLAEQQRIKEEKEREVARLRELQEKASDRQSEIDELRAKRAFELADRNAREKERKEAELRAKHNRELFEARKHQAFEKEARLQEQVKHDRDEFQKIIQTQKIEKDNEVKVEQEKKAMVDEHAKQLKKQIVLNEEKRVQEKRTHLEEGKKMKDKLSSEKKILENIKSKKLEALQENGIPAKYTVDLAKKKIAI